MPMKEKYTPEIKKVNPKRKPLFIIGLVLGILLGAILTMLMVDWFHYRIPKNVQVINEAPSENGKSDTLVNYVIHKYERVPNYEPSRWNEDTLTADSIYLEDESEDWMMDEQDLEEIEDQEQHVQQEQMLWQKRVKITYLDNNKDEIDPIEGGSIWLQVQVWNTPIKNKKSYLLSDKALKIKGIQENQFKIYHYKNTLYLVVNHKTYPLHRNQQYEKLIETTSVEF